MKAYVESGLLLHCFHCNKKYIVIYFVINKQKNMNIHNIQRQM